MGRFISWHWSAKAEPQLAAQYFKMDSDSESHSSLANECIQLLDDLRLWLSRNIGIKGKKNIL